MIISGLSLPTAMKTRTLIIAVALCVTAATSGFCANPQIGTWKLNEAKSTFTPGMGKNTTVVFSRLGRRPVAGGYDYRSGEQEWETDANAHHLDRQARRQTLPRDG